MDLNSGKASFLQDTKTLSYHEKEAYSPLCMLSTELAEIVASSLQPSDLAALRLTCKTLHTKSFHVFWKTLLHTVRTDLSDASLEKLETIPQDARHRGYVKHIVFMGFDEHGKRLGGGYTWESCHQPFSHFRNIQEHPAVNRLSNILNQLNCKSFEVFAKFGLPDFQTDYRWLKPTDMITVFMDIVASTRLPVTAFSIDMFDFYYPDPHKLKVSDKDHFATIGQSLEELRLLYDIEDGIVTDWTFNLLCHAPNLRTLHLMNGGYKEIRLIHRCAAVDGLWSQLRDFKLEYISMFIDDLMVLLRRCRNTLRVFQMETLRIEADIEGIRQMFSTLSTFPVLESFAFDCVGFGVHGKVDLIYSPTLAENPFVDESRENKFRISLKNKIGATNSRVAYSGPKIDVALDILARGVQGIPRLTEIRR